VFVLIGSFISCLNWSLRSKLVLLVLWNCVNRAAQVQMFMYLRFIPLAVGGTNKSIVWYTSALVWISPICRMLIIKILASLRGHINTAEHVYVRGFIHVVFANLRTQL
jgi:hypothetical protein